MKRNLTTCQLEHQGPQPRGAPCAGRPPRPAASRCMADRRRRRPAGSGAGARRPRLPRGQQPEAGRLPGPGAGCRSTPARVHDLHMVQSVLALPEHLDVFERGIAREARLLASPARRARGSPSWSAAGQIEIGAIHTYLELFAPLLRRPDAARSRWWRRRPPTATATSTPAPTPRTRRRSSRRPPSRAAS